MCHKGSFNARSDRPMNCPNFNDSSGGALSDSKDDTTKSYLDTDKNSPAFQSQLAKLGLEIRDIIGDGNCLFRSLADQMDGNSDNHAYYRDKVCEYIESNRDDFEPFLLDKCDFVEYVRNLRLPGTYAGNDAIVGFSKLFQVDIVIHQLNRPPITINSGVHGDGNQGGRELHLSYHNSEHYASVRVIGDQSASPTRFRSSGAAAAVSMTTNSSCSAAIDSVVVEDAAMAVDDEETERSRRRKFEPDCGGGGGKRPRIDY